MTNIPINDELKKILEDYRLLPEYFNVNLQDANTESLFGDRPLHTACTRGSLHDVEVLASFGADVNAKGEHGFTPLHQAVQHGHLDIVKMLIDLDASIDVRNDDEDTPEDLARHLGEVKIGNYLAHVMKRR
ncbi:MAG: ankyrin repeat domain-containing protein [Candidatus Thiodiazotropha sp. (ex Dulcina madagascariensis)]|nr:ankyrin repeat domain-containing protein [Candidatus Thiodiazotropha sp. (ex Dulcina madagascariensis)]